MEHGAEGTGHGARGTGHGARGTGRNAPPTANGVALLPLSHLLIF